MHVLVDTDQVEVCLTKGPHQNASESSAAAMGSNRKPLPELGVRGYDSVPLYQSGNRIARPYGFGFVVTCGWLEDLSVEQGLRQPGEGTMSGGLEYIRRQIGMDHHSSVKVPFDPKDLDMPSLACLVWIANNMTSWGMDMANDREMVEKLKSAFNTDMEPKWYRSRLGGCPLVCALNSFSSLVGYN